jgi:hypothetical protein
MQTYNGAVVINGGLTINSPSTIVNSTVVDIADRVIHVNNSTGVVPPPIGTIAGISVHRGNDGFNDRDHAGLFWVEASSRWRAAFDDDGDDFTITALLDFEADRFIGDGSLLTNLDGAEITGTVARANLPPEIAYEDEVNNFTLANTFSGPGTALTVTNSASFGDLEVNLQPGVSMRPYGGGAGQTSELRFYNILDTLYVGFKAPDVLLMNTVWTVPIADGTANQALVTDGSGILSWASFGTGTVTSVSASSPLASSGGTTPNISLTGIVVVANGGTNSGVALVNNRLMWSSGGAIVEATALTNGQLFIGSTGAAPVAASLTAGANISITPGAGTITIAATGTVTSVGLALPASVFSVSGSPVTSSGTLTGAFVTQTANTIFAGPASGGAATPTFRSLVEADLTAVTNVTFVEMNGNGTTTDAHASDIPSTFTTTNTTYTQAAVLTTGALTGTFILYWSAEASNSSAATTIDCRLQNVTDIDTYGETTFNLANASTFVPVSGIAEIVLGGVSKNIEIQFKRTGVSGTITIRRARIMMRRKV